MNAPPDKRPNVAVRLIVWAHRNRRTINAWVVRIVSFYFGYRILNHEIYGKQTAEPLLIFLGLWLCGIAPATFFDGIRQIGVSVQSEIEKQTSDMAKDAPENPTHEPESKDNANG